MSEPYRNVKILLAFFQANPNQTFTSEELMSRLDIPAGSMHGAFAVLKKSHLTRH